MIERAVIFSIKQINADSLDEKISMLQAKLAALTGADEAEAYSQPAFAYAA